MNKPRQFDNIKQGEIVRYLVETPFYEKTKKDHWSFGIVRNDYMKNFFSIVTMGSWKGFRTVRFRKDGMNKSGKDAIQIVFRLTPEEQEHPLIKEFLSLKNNYEAAERELSEKGNSMYAKLENPETNIFPQYPLPKI